MEDGLLPQRDIGEVGCLVSPKIEDNQCPAAGCPRHLTDAKSGRLLKLNPQVGSWGQA